MDVQLQELIDKIKKDGIASAEQEANTIKENARKEADSIIADAKAKAESIIKEAQTENARLEKVSIDAIKQASRNLLISFRDGISSELSAIIESMRSNILGRVSSDISSQITDFSSLSGISFSNSFLVTFPRS